MLDVIRTLTKKRDELLAQATKIGHAITALGHTSKPTRKRRVSAAARKKMSDAAKKRWAGKKKTAK